MKYKYIIVILLLLLIFYTPQFISDQFYGCLFGDMKFVYTDQNKKQISYTFNHRDYDGALIAHSIEKGLVNPVINDDITYEFQPYQYLPGVKVGTYSKFTSSIAHLVFEMLKHQNRKLNICIIVSVRNGIMNKGNFLKYANYTVYPNDTIETICEKQHNAVTATQNHNYIKKNPTIYELIKCLNIDYMFNNWRNLSQINALTRKSLYKILNTDVDNLIRKKSRSCVFLDYFKDKYVISHIDTV